MKKFAVTTTIISKTPPALQTLIGGKYKSSISVRQTYDDLENAIKTFRRRSEECPDDHVVLETIQKRTRRS